MEIRCPNCGYKGLPRAGGNLWLALFLFFTTWWLLWIPFVLYCLLAPESKCPKCGYTNVIKLSEKEISLEEISNEKKPEIIEKPNLCPDCGKYYQGNPNFCPNCGGELKVKIIDKGFIDLTDNVAFRTIKDGCNCFGHSYKGYQKAEAIHPYELDISIWFPKLYSNEEWDNSISNNENLIIERCKDDNKRYEHVGNCLNSKRTKRIVFVGVKNELGDLMYGFKGLYELDKNKSNPDDGLFWNRIATRVKTYKSINSAE